MYPNYYGNQLNQIIQYQENINQTQQSILQEQQEIKQELKSINATVSVALGLIFVIGIIRHILAR